MRVCRPFLFLLFASTVAFAASPDRIAAAIDSSRTVDLARSLHPKAQPQYDQGAMDPQTRLGYVTFLTAPSASQQRALDKLLADQQNPASPLYHQWLTPEQYAERFGLSLNDVNKITAWLKAQGFTVLSVARGRNSIIVSGTVAQFESAFQTQIHRFNVEGERHFANTSPLKVPAALSGIVTGVRGLHDFRMKPLEVRRQSGLRPFYYDSTTGILAAPGDIATVYDISPLYNASPAIDGTGQKLAVVGQTDIYPADIDDFRAGFSLPNSSTLTASCTTNPTTGVITACNSTNFQYILNTGDTDPGTPSTCGDLSEADLDIEWAGATARNAQIIYINSPVVFNSTCTQTNSNGGVESALAYAIQNNVAPVVSMSYGICEAQAGNDETELQQANTQGMTIVNSSGDLGAAGCDFNPPNASQPFQGAVLGQAVSYPASSPEVTGVGGTHIPLSEFNSTYWNQANGPNDGSAKSYVPEVAWNDDSELALFCQSNTSNIFCTQGGNPAITGWVKLGASATAAQVQQDIWISSGGGGPSNCFTESNTGVCQAGFAQPSWQTGLSVPAVAPTLAHYRFVPDVSLMASPNFPGYIICAPRSEFGFTGSTSACAVSIQDAVDTYGSIIGGTSASAPILAGIVTLLNQYLTASSPGLGNINPKLYSLAATPSNNAFHQVNTGNNVVSCQVGTPTNQTSLPAIQCPTTGVLGFDSANFDTTTHYNLVTGLGSVDVNNLALAWAASRPASSIAVTALPTSILLGQSVTLTATVTGTAPVGTVSFFDNASATAIGTATLTSASGGIGTFTWTPTASQVGMNSITASYGGDGYNGPSPMSAATTVTVVSPDFTWSSADSTHTVLAGQTSLIYHFTAAPVAPATTFAAAVTFGCTFAPTDTTMACVFSPTSIAAGAGATPVSVTITTKGPNTGPAPAIRQRADKRSPWLPLTLPIAGVVLVGLAGKKVSRHSKVAGLCVSLVLFALLIACGGSHPPISVTVTPATASLYPNNTGWPSQTQNFTASVANTSNTAVNWTASSGSIDASGKYTAPTLAAGLPSSVTVTATSQADSTKTGTAMVTLNPATVPGSYTVTVTATEAATAKSPTVALVVQ